MATSLGFEHEASWGVAELRSLAACLPYCTRCTHLSLAGIDLSGGEAAQCVAEMLLRPSCPVTRLDLKGTAIGADALERLLASPRLRAIELSELPVFTSDQCRGLTLTGGQLTSGPRVLVSRAATVRRIFEVQADEAEEQRRHLERRAAHRLGWEESDEPRIAPHSPDATPLARAQAAIGQLAAGAAMSAYSALSPRRRSSSGSFSGSSQCGSFGSSWASTSTKGKLCSSSAPLRRSVGASPPSSTARGEGVHV